MKCYINDSSTRSNFVLEFSKRFRKEAISGQDVINEFKKIQKEVFYPSERFYNELKRNTDKIKLAGEPVNLFSIISKNEFKARTEHSRFVKSTQNAIPKLRFEDGISEIFKGSQILTDKLIRKFTSDMMKNVIFDESVGEIILDPLDVNLNLIHYKNELFKEITNEGKLFNGSVANTELYNKVMNDFDIDINPGTLNKLDSEQNESKRKTQKRLFAYFILNNFDKLTKLHFGDVISIDKRFNDQLNNPASQLKYITKIDTAKSNMLFSDGSTVSAMDSLNPLVKLIAYVIPKINLEGKEKGYLDSQRFTQAIASLKELEPFVLDKLYKTSNGAEYRFNKSIFENEREYVKNLLDPNILNEVFNATIYINGIAVKPEIKTITKNNLRSISNFLKEYIKQKEVGNEYGNLNKKFDLISLFAEVAVNSRHMVYSSYETKDEFDKSAKGKTKPPIEKKSKDFKNYEGNTRNLRNAISLSLDSLTTNAEDEKFLIEFELTGNVTINKEGISEKINITKLDDNIPTKDYFKALNKLLNLPVSLKNVNQFEKEDIVAVGALIQKALSRNGNKIIVNNDKILDLAESNKFKNFADVYIDVVGGMPITSLEDNSGNKLPFMSIFNLNELTEFNLNKFKKTLEDKVGINLFVDTPGLFKGIETKLEIGHKGSSTSASSVGKTTGFVMDFYYDFIGELLNDDNSATMAFQPCTYADKSTPTTIKVNLDAKMKNSKKLSHMNYEELVEVKRNNLHSKTEYLIENIFNDYALLAEVSDNFKISKTLSIESKVKALNKILADKNFPSKLEDAILKIQQSGRDIEITEEVHYSRYKDGTKFNNVLFRDYEISSNKESFKRYIDARKKQYIKHTKNAVNKLDKTHAYLWNITGATSEKDGLIRLEQLLHKLGMKGSKTKFMQDWVTVDSGIHSMEFTKGDVLNPLLEKFFIYHSMMADQFMDISIGSVYQHPSKAIDGFEIPEGAKNVKKVHDIAKQIDPSISKKDAYRAFTHFKKTSKSDNVNEFKDNFIHPIDLEESLRTVTMSKRAAAYLSTFDKYQQGTHEGIPSVYKIANIHDTEGKAYGFAGREGNVTVHDGSAFTTRIFSKLEENSIIGKKYRGDKKPIGLSTNTRNLSSTFLKFASFEINNERMRQSSHSDISLEKTFEKMTRIPFTKEAMLNLTRNRNNKPLTINDLAPNGIFYYENGEHWQIKSLKLADAETNQYTIELQGVDLNGQVRDKKNKRKVSKTINSVWDIFQAMGGAWSMSKVGDQLEWSDASQDIIAEMAGTVYYNTKFDNPIKYTPIAAVINRSAVKNGVSNLNSSKKFLADNDEDFITSKFSTINYGIQLDPSHNADLSEISEITQVLSALEEKGNSHGLSRVIYGDLKDIMLNAIKPYVEKIVDKKLVNDPKAKRQLYNIISTQLVGAFKNQDKFGLWDAIKYNVNVATELQEVIHSNINKALKEEGKKRASFKEILPDLLIPFSSNEIFGKFTSNLISTFNKSAIKRGYSGLMGTLVPSYGIIQMFRNKKGESYSSTDILTMAVKKYTDTANPIDTKAFFEGKTNRQLMDLYLEESSDFSSDMIFNDEVNLIHELNLEDVIRITEGKNIKNISLNNLDDFYLIESNLEKFLSNHGFKSIDSIEKVYDKPTDLAPAKFTWTEEGSDKVNNIFRTPEYLAVYQANTSKKPKAEIKRLERILQDKFVELSKLAKEGKIIVSMTNYELIAPRTNKSNFNLNKNHSLSQIKYNKNYFINKLKWTYKIDKNLIGKVDLAFRKNSGKHLYININPGIVVEGTDPFIETESILSEDNIENTYWVDEKGERISILPKGSIVKNINGKEILYLKSVDDLEEIYKSQKKDYGDITLLAESDNENFGELLKFTVDKNIGDIRREYEKILKIEDKFTINNILIKTRDNIDEKTIESQGTKMHNSFIKSLDFIAARIPAQAMQSFMGMSLVGFNDSDSNPIYVSHWQIYLQGSDFDIDKAFTMGLYINENGLIDTWSPYFDLKTIEGIEESINIPSPDGKNRKVYTAKDVRTITPIEGDVNSILITTIEGAEIKARNLSGIKIVDRGNSEITELNNLKEITNLLSTVDETHEALYSDKVFEGKYDFYHNPSTIINKHNTFSSKGLDNGLKNKVVFNIAKITKDLKNFMQATMPIDDVMDEYHDGKDNARPHDSEIGMNPTWGDGGSTVSYLQEKNASGKAVIGIAASGQKGFFALSYYFNEMYEGVNPETMSPMDNQVFIKDIQLNEDKTEWLATISDTVVSEEQKEVLQGYLNSVLGSENGDDIKVKYYDDDASLAISGLISASVDNAKELILAFINAGQDMAKYHLFLMSMGLPIEDIINIMTSPEVNAFVENSEKIPIFGKGGKKKTPANLVPIEKMTNEFSDFTRMLAINQGVKTDLTQFLEFSDKFEDRYLTQEFKFISKIFGKKLPENPSEVDIKSNDIRNFKGQFTAKNREELADLVIRYKPYLKDNKEDIKNVLIRAEKAGVTGFTFDFTKFWSDANYQTAATNYYNLFKEAINIYDAITKVPHFASMMQIYITARNVLSVSSKKANFVLNESQNMIKNYIEDKDSTHKGKFFVNLELDNEPDSNYTSLTTDKIRFNNIGINRVREYYTDVIIQDFIKSHRVLKNIKFTVPTGYDYYEKGTEALRRADKNVEIDLTSSTGIASYKRWFETYFKKLPAYSNTILKDLVWQKETNFLGNEVSILRLPMDMQHIRSESDQAKFEGYVMKLDELKNQTNMFSEAKDENGEVVNIPASDLLYLYSLVVNRDKFGVYKLTKLFTENATMPNSYANNFIAYEAKVEKEHWEDSDAINVPFDITDLYYRIYSNRKDDNAFPDIQVLSNSDKTIFTNLKESSTSRIVTEEVADNILKNKDADISAECKN